LWALRTRGPNAFLEQILSLFGEQMVGIPSCPPIPFAFH
jgi:hypothetical protein